ncbi:MAG: hypothetical protein ACQEP5_04480 [Actinomycetota bacterium]
MGARLAKKESNYSRKAYPLLYLVDREKQREEKIVYSNSGLFYIIVVAVLLVCLGALFNVGLKIQTINYQRDILQLNEIISVEQERQDRISLKISELRSPSRIIDTAQDELGMEISPEIKTVEVAQGSINNNEKIQEYLARGPSEATRSYNNLLGTVYYIQDLVMVVSESVLTFFIP